VLLFCAALFPLVSCRGPQAGEATKTQPDTREVVDDLGRTIKLPQPVRRVVTLAPNLTEIVFAVGGSDKLAGDTTFCNYPEDAKKIQKVGDTINPNLEAIIALKPDVVLVSKASQLQTFLPRMEEQKIPVFVAGATDLDGVFKDISTIGDILGNKAKAAELVSSLKKRADAVEEKSKSATPYHVFVQISEEPLYTAGKSSFITDLIERAGGTSVTANIDEDYPRLSKETALAFQPDVIIISGMTDGDQKPNAVFANSPAVKNKKVFQIDGDLLTRPGPRLVDGLEQIAQKLSEEK
jgi:iron complex transport system substrate-binding protein